MAATLPLSRSMRVPLSQRQDVNEFGTDNNGISEDWGPSSVPPTSQFNIPWDDQVVPALRKKLEAESKDISKRISRIEESDNGWARSRESIDRRDPRMVRVRDSPDRRMSREIVQHHRESSIDQFHNRFASVRAPSRQRADVAASSFPFDSPRSEERNAAASMLSNDATARAREKARQIAARQKAQQQQQQQNGGGSRDSVISSSDMHGYNSQQGMESSIDAIPENEVTGGSRAHGSSFEKKRFRTQSTPMRPSVDVVNPDYATSRHTQNHSSQEPSRSTSTHAARNPNGHQRTNSLSRRKAAAMDPKLIEEFGPLGATPSPAAKLLRVHQDLDPSSASSSSPSMRNRAIQPDAFRSLSPPEKSRYYREGSAPPAFGDAGNDSGLGEFGASPGSKSVNSWEDQIIPTVARKLQQEQFLKAGKEGRLSRYEGLIDTWDKNGLPLSRSDVMAMQQHQRANKLQEEQEQRQQEQELDEVEEEQVLTPGPVPPASLHRQRSNNLSPIEATFDRSRSRASSRRSQRSAHSQQQQQQQQQQQDQQQPVDNIPLQEMHHQHHQYPQSQSQPQSHPQPTPQPTPTQTQAVATQPKPNNASRQDDVEKGGCCCIVM
ncbi:uncharacterized protein UTRI_01708 [Ustilago trichophora]|uniref:Uncharacterized protein n=1 Tax=Ustilago trichophora TaxID=86804 RepID=A0A5C3DZD2_9BASI|nr:uncharacterized protein UTRI_01708 [Ustilago trichophora]